MKHLPYKRENWSSDPQNPSRCCVHVVEDRVRGPLEQAHGLNYELWVQGETPPKRMIKEGSQRPT